MAQNLSFGRGGTSSWADDDDVDFQPLPKIAPTETPQPIEEEEIQHHEQQRDEPRRGGYDRDDRRGYGDRRGGYEERRREPREERPKNPVPDVGPWKLFVGNLSFRLTEDDLADFIGPDGIKDIRFPRDYENRPKGFAYVEFYEKEHLVQALDLDGCKLDGRHVKMDVALDRERERKPRDNGFFEKRNDRRQSHDRRDDAPRERQRLTLLPRTTSTEKKDSETHKPNIFGDAKPRDEQAYLERKKALDLERKAKAKEEKEAKVKAKAEAATLARKGSHDDSFRGGRGRGRGDRRPEGGRGRGAPAKEVATTRKAEPRSKRTEPPTTKISAPAPAKTTNAFELLDDSDSDSD